MKRIQSQNQNQYGDHLDRRNFRGRGGTAVIQLGRPRRRWHRWNGPACSSAMNRVRPDFKSRQMRSMTALANAVFLCAAVLSMSGAAVAQTQERSDSSPISGPDVARHSSRRSLDPSQADFQTIARETADALAGNIEQPVMTSTRGSFLAKWQVVRGASVLACRPRQKTVMTAVFPWFCLHRCESLGQAASRPILDDQSEKRNSAAP
jgi:hypothetical protein